MKIPVAGKALCQQLRANHLAVFENQTAVGFVGKDRAGDSGNQQRIAHTQQNSRNKCEAN